MERSALGTSMWGQDMVGRWQSTVPTQHLTQHCQLLVSSSLFKYFALLNCSLWFAGQAFFIPIIGKFQIRETILLIILITMPLSRHLAQGLATEPWMFYLGPCFDFLGSYSVSLIRSMISTCVPMYELGKAMAFLGSMESLFPIITTQIFALVWQVWLANTVM